MWAQNPTDSEFQGNLFLDDRQFNLTFKVKGNSPNSSMLFQGWNPAPYDVSTNKILTINYSVDAGNNWASFAIADVGSGAVSSSTATAYEIVNALNNNSTFSALYTASVATDNRGNFYPSFAANRARERFKTYISNTGAEIALRFNKKAGVAELPGYMDRHTIANKSIYPDGLGMLVALDPTTTRDQTIIDDAGLSYVVGLTSGSATITIANTAPFAVGDSIEVYNGTTSQAKLISSISANVSITANSTWGGATGVGKVCILHTDYQLLRGRSGYFMFSNQTVDGSSRVISKISYPAGAKVGDLAVKTTYSYTASQTAPDKICPVPYVLTASDLVIP